MTATTRGRYALHAGWLAGLAFALALLIAASVAPDYLHARHAVAMLGAKGAAHALAFNAFGYALPGLSLAVFAIALDRPLARLAAGFSARIGWNLLLISGLAFAAQGLLPFDPLDVDGAASKRHVLALTIALLSWLPATALLAASLRRDPRTRALTQIGLASGAAMLAMLALPIGEWMPALRDAPGHAQRLILFVYFAWPAAVALVALHAKGLEIRD
jgi:hypothetical membrane protein